MGGADGIGGKGRHRNAIGRWSGLRRLPRIGVQGVDSRSVTREPHAYAARIRRPRETVLRRNAPRWRSVRRVESARPHANRYSTLIAQEKLRDRAGFKRIYLF
ncbi:hypothetical protein [Lysobacter sp. Root690]|uniref:hypothetical protein n=1 Tax=Lysobacter sp. Root690 TaxID=1736588 RepID=UPI0006FE5DD6|nr:hypothetical protein [Lysobacter sp. Root690]KRB06192.1 hypothetical protein ASD86_15580 [Lysobacter sp. Root690]